MLTVIRQAQLFTPHPAGIKDVLIGGGKVLAIENNIDLSINDLSAPGLVTEVDGKGMLLVPGFVDSLVHISGGGGEAGFASRTPQMQLSDATTAGITTVVAALGTDAVSRTHTDLVAKAKGLKEEGLNVFCYTGSYHIPAKSLTGDVEKDIMFIDEIIGIGEVAIADHRGSQPSVQQLAHLASQSRVAGMLSGKRGTVSIHVGPGPEHLDLLHKVADETDIPLTQFYPTHMNRNQELVEAGIRFCQYGGTIDFTTSTTEYDLAHGEMAAAQALAFCIDKGVNPEQLTMSSDGHASLPIFDKNNQLVGLEVGQERSLLMSFIEAVQQHDVTIEHALMSVTSNPATILGLKKGRILANADADLVLLNDTDLHPEYVWSRGQLMVADRKPLVVGRFE
ncbi:beta-aspartyl-peptidase [Psychrosphaera ytuae]|uniref:Isoaspartyl dipeptidase n=1 Tax=Psychrosphaera ytuae TaxID=2820710 RepID=A0A975DAY6_9GAMM|nr:beta-aspartyl-peptidase [Psychrosphaera ytuae]QTH63503.1 beta-aspartyl-peptidase [Psychrosphaera ytuae]